MDIKNMLKSKRLELEYTMLELANKVGVSEATVSRWESGNITNMRRDSIKNLARALKIPSTFLVYEPEDPEFIYGEEAVFAFCSELTKNYSLLNDEGKKKAEEYVADLLENKRYIQSNAQNTPVTTANFNYKEQIAAFGGITDIDDTPHIT